MPSRTKNQLRDSAASAREAKKSLPKNHFKKKAAERKAKMGPVSRNEVYPQQDLMQLCGWGRMAWRKAVDSGLAIFVHGTTVFVTGEAYFQWVSKNSTDSQ
jgi:hypothetical protein